jgi:hypothetical protein
MTIRQSMNDGALDISIEQADGDKVKKDDASDPL